MSDPTKIFLDGGYYRSVPLYGDDSTDGNEIGSVVILERITDAMMDFARNGTMQFSLSPIVKNEEIVGLVLSHLPSVAKND
jgi:hypothetical protein